MEKEQLLARLDEMANELTALHVVAVQLSLTPDFLEEAIASIERFIEQEKTP